VEQTVSNATFDRGAMLERLGGDEALLREILDSFRHELPRMILVTRRAFRSADPAAIERAGHTLKGALLSISAGAAADAAQAVEELGRTGRLGAAAEVLDRLESRLEHLHDALATEASRRARR